MITNVNHSGILAFAELKIYRNSCHTCNELNDSETLQLKISKLSR